MKKILLTLGCFTALSDVYAMTVQPEGTNGESQAVAVVPVQAEEPAQAVVSEVEATGTTTSSIIVIKDDSENEKVSSPNTETAKLENLNDKEDKDAAASPKADEEASTTPVEQANEKAKEVVESASPKISEEKTSTPKLDNEEYESKISQSSEKLYLSKRMCRSSFHRGTFCI